MDMFRLIETGLRLPDTGGGESAVPTVTWMRSGSLVGGVVRSLFQPFWQRIRLPLALVFAEIPYAKFSECVGRPSEVDHTLLQ